MMKALTPAIVDQLRWDADRHEMLLRKTVRERLAAAPLPRADDQMIVSYFFALRSMTLSKMADEIAYHSTSGTHDVPPGSLLEQCTGTVVRIDPFDAAERTGLLHMAYPLKMLLQPDGHATSTDLLHVAAGAIVFNVYENQHACLLAVALPEAVVRTFPGPAYGPVELRRRVQFPADQPAFGTILKPTAGITPELVGTLVEEAAGCPLFLFVKEDENLLPHLDYSPVDERVRRAVAGIQKARQQHGAGD